LAPSQSANWKVTAGRLKDAWSSYPKALTDFRGFPRGKPVFLTGTHRSGTTWAAAMLAEPGLWYAHEPFMPTKGLWREAFTYADPATTRADIDSLLIKVVAGKHRVASNNPNTDHPLMPLRLFKPPIRRVMIKDPIACLLTGYIAQHFDFDIIVLFRHPAGFAASVTQLGWPVGKFLKQFLADESLMGQHLESYSALLEAYQERDDLEAAAVLHGALNRVLWSQAQGNRNIRQFRFEDLCHAPLDAFRAIFAELGLPYGALTQQRHNVLCARQEKPTQGYHPHAVARNSRSMAEGWKSKVTEAQLHRLRDIWERFEIPMYDESRDWCL